MTKISNKMMNKNNKPLIYRKGIFATFVLGGLPWLLLLGQGEMVLGFITDEFKHIDVTFLKTQIIKIINTKAGNENLLKSKSNQIETFTSHGLRQTNSSNYAQYYKNNISLM